MFFTHPLLDGIVSIALLIVLVYALIASRHVKIDWNKVSSYWFATPEEQRKIDEFVKRDHRDRYEWYKKAGRIEEFRKIWPADCERFEREDWESQGKP